MAPPRIDRDEIQRRVNAVNRYLSEGWPPSTIGGKGETAVSKAAEEFDRDPSAFAKSLKRGEERYGLKPDWSLYKREVHKHPFTIEERKNERRKDDRITELERQVKDLLRELNAAEDLRRAVFGMTEQPPVPPKWVSSKSQPGSPGVPMLFTSDFQWGEVVSANEMDGVNEFNQRVASRRYKLLIEKTISLCFDYTVNPKYPGIIYLRGGDAISGDIHDELRETNDLQSIPAVRDLVEHETAGIQKLADRFGNVFVVSVPGNHGRTTRKPHSKRYAETNYDTLSAWWLEAIFQSDDRVQFWTPVSGDAVIPVYGYRFCLSHGDRIGARGGSGFIGPAATITRGMKKMADYYASLGTPIDVFLVGHFHTSLELEYGFSNGSLPGLSEYARDAIRPRPSPPMQWLLVVHPEYGVSQRWKIFLEKAPKHPPMAWDAVKRLERRAA